MAERPEEVRFARAVEDFQLINLNRLGGKKKRINSDAVQYRKKLSFSEFG